MVRLSALVMLYRGQKMSDKTFVLAESLWGNDPTPMFAGIIRSTFEGVEAFNAQVDAGTAMYPKWEVKLACLRDTGKLDT